MGTRPLSPTCCYLVLSFDAGYTFTLPSPFSCLACFSSVSTVDVEGHEWAALLGVFQAMAQGRLWVGQLQVELHINIKVRAWGEGKGM